MIKRITICAILLKPLLPYSQNIIKNGLYLQFSDEHISLDEYLIYGNFFPY